MQGRTIEEKGEVYALLERVKNDDREAFRELVSLYQKRIFLLAFSFFHNREDAMDIVQETFMRLYKRFIPSVKEKILRAGSSRLLRIYV